MFVELATTYDRAQSSVYSLPNSLRLRLPSFRKLSELITRPRESLYPYLAL
jgi:hypothetical protein